MRRNSSFTLCYLSGTPYILPYGQQIANHRRGLQTNATGAFIWDLLETEQNFQKLLNCCAVHYQAAAHELPLLETDIKQFLTLLQSYGMLEDTIPQKASDSYPDSFLQIAGLTLKLTGPKEAFSASFDSFRISDASTIHQQIVIQESSFLPKRNGTILLRTEEVMILEDEDIYILLFPSNNQLVEAHLSKDGKLAVFYCLPPYTEEFREGLFHAIRFTFLYLAQLHHMVAIHSASLLYQEKAWLFSGHSGSGKSIHTGFWNTTLKTPILNGDLNLIAFTDKGSVIHGIPWCGTSGIADTQSYSLGGIILLKKHYFDYIEDLSESKKQLYVLQRFISPSWTLSQMQQNCDFSAKIASSCLVCRYHCTKTPEAVSPIKKEIDTYLEGFVQNDK